MGGHVAGVIGALQSRFLREAPDPEAVGALARLRRGIGREPGSDYTLERYLGVPEALVQFVPDDRPADVEYAVHDAVSLYALHQQSQRKPMHLDGDGLGRAVSSLLNKTDGPEGVRRRFAALGTASTYQEVIYHLRGLTTMLRGHAVPLDYGLLAEDLLDLRKPYGAAKVRAAWGREFFRSRRTVEADNSATPANDSQEENGS
ncbi:type I-E CRISPR-associated protein Cse2/CasB [Luedemannella helvata]|uniref:Type I-E CRISPR-associated protein Cse2/CasB n=1 Tax=Luedemannella helvata TaxID=349315 RepID=A0ABP4VZM7_9ACTN